MAWTDDHNDTVDLLTKKVSCELDALLFRDGINPDQSLRSRLVEFIVVDCLGYDANRPDPFDPDAYEGPMDPNLQVYQLVILLNQRAIPKAWRR